MQAKENDIVKHINHAGTECIARVRWVNEKGEAGVTFLSPESHKGSAQVVAVEELEVLRGNIQEDLKDVPTEELIAAINRLRNMRLPKKQTTFKTSITKRSTKSKLDALFAEGGETLSNLIAKAIEEIKLEKGGGETNGD